MTTKRMLLGVGGNYIVTPQTFSLVQYGTDHGDGSHSPSVTLGALTPGNVLIALLGRRDTNTTNPSQIAGPTLAIIGSRFRASSSAGGNGWLYRRVVQSGDGATITFGSLNEQALIVAEFSGLVGTGPYGSPVASSDNDASTAPLLAFSPGGSAFMAIAGFVNKLKTDAPAGTWTPNADTTVVGGSLVQTTGGASHDSIVLCYGTCDVSLGGTQANQGSAGWGGTGTAWQRSIA